jgi:hypothetical protein
MQQRSAVAVRLDSEESCFYYYYMSLFHWLSSDNIIGQNMLSEDEGDGLTVTLAGVLSTAAYLKTRNNKFLY